MKKMLIAWVFGMLASICGVWAIVEFILYLVKDNPFNVWSIILTAVFYIVAIIISLRVMSKDF